MLTKITENYGFERDKYCYILYFTGQRQKGVFGTTEKTDEMVDFQERIGYFTTVTAMLKKAAEDAANRKMTEEQVPTIKEYFNMFNETIEELNEAVKGGMFEPVAVSAAAEA